MSKLKITGNFIFIVILCLVIILPYFFSIGLGRDLVLGSPNADTANFFIPIRSLGFSLLSKGILPLWNPYIFSGAPFLAESQLAIFYPFNLIHLFLPISLALNLLIILHQILAGTFMYLYLKRLTKDSFSSFIGAIIFVLSSFFITRIFAGHITVICVISWIPILFLLIDKSISREGNIFTVLAGFVLALQIFAGHIQFVFISLVALFLYAIYMNIRARGINKLPKDALYILFSAAILGAGLSAVQFIPSGELLKEAARFNDPYWNYAFSMPPENIITILSPGFFGWIKDGIYWGKWYPWEVSIYVGILPLLLSFFAILKANRYSKFFAGLFLFSLILSFGAYIPLYRHLYKYIVGFNLFRANGRFLILGVFSLSVLSSLGCRNLSQDNDKGRQKRLMLTIIFAIALVSILGSFKFILLYLPSLGDSFFSSLISYDKLAAQWGYNFGYHFSLNLIRIIASSNLNSSIVFLLLSIALLTLYIKPLFSEDLKKVLIASFIIADLWGFGIKYFSTFPLKNCYLDNKTVTFLQDNIRQNRYLPLDILFPNIGVINKIPSIGGYSGCIPRRYTEFINFTQGRPLDTPFVFASIRKPSRLFDLLNLKYILGNTDIKSNLELIYEQGNLKIYQNPASLPKAFIVHKALVIQGRDDILKNLADNSFDFKETVILEEPFNQGKTVHSVSIVEAQPSIITYSPNRVVINADVKADGYLILCDNYYPGWQAYLNGKRTHIFVADYILRAVFLPAGNHTVEFIYSPASLKIGAFISFLFLLFTAIILHFCLRKKNFMLK